MKINPLLHKLTNNEYASFTIEEEGSDYYSSLFKSPPDYTILHDIGIIVCSVISGSCGTYMLFSALGRNTFAGKLGCMLLALLCIAAFLYCAYRVYKTAVFKDRIESGIYSASKVIIESKSVNKAYNRNNDKDALLVLYYIHVNGVKIHVTKKYYDSVSIGDEILLFVIDDYLAGSVLVNKSEIDFTKEVLIDTVGQFEEEKAKFEQLEDTITIEQVNEVNANESNPIDKKD